MSVDLVFLVFGWLTLHMVARRYGTRDPELPRGSYGIPEPYWHTIVLLFLVTVVGLGMFLGHLAALILGWPVNGGTGLGFIFSLLILAYSIKGPRPPRRRKRSRKFNLSLGRLRFDHG